MRKLLYLIVLSGALALAGQAELQQPRGAHRDGSETKTAKRLDVVKVVPHLAAASDWKSVLILRNDLDRSISLGLDLYGPDGLPASAVFYDSDDNQYESDRFDFTMAAFEVYTIEFDHMSDPGLVNLQAFLFSDENDQQYSVEAIFNNFQGPDKVATVGGGLQVPGDNFFMNIDERQDPYTLNPKLRGLAVTNAETQTCTCSVVLWSNLGGQTDVASVTIPPLAKWVGPASALVDTDALPNGLGVLDFDCDRQVGVTGLSFETGTPIVGSTPIDYYVFQNGKKQIRR